MACMMHKSFDKSVLHVIPTERVTMTLADDIKHFQSLHAHLWNALIVFFFIYKVYDVFT